MYAYGTSKPFGVGGASCFRHLNRAGKISAVIIIRTCRHITSNSLCFLRYPSPVPMNESRLFEVDGI